MSTVRRRVKRPVSAGNKPTPVSPSAARLPKKWLAMSSLLVLLTLVFAWKFAPANTAPAAPSQSTVASAPVTLPELAELPPALHQSQEIPMVGEAGHRVPMGKLKEGDEVWHKGKWMVVKSIKHETVTETKEVEVPVKPATPKPREETSLDLDLSQGGDTFEETLIVPASQQAVLVDGTLKPSRQLNMGDRIYMTGQHLALVTKVQTKWYTPPPPSVPDEHGNVFSRVIGTTKRMTDRILYLHTDKETIGTTSEHPFSIDGKGWVQAGRLQQGDHIKTEDGKTVAVESLEVKAERKLVYNLKVEGTENYFVGKNRLLVHNGGDCVPNLLSGEYLAGKAPKQVAPGIYELEGQYINDLGQVEPWRAHYDEFGRMIGRTDYTAGNSAAGIPPVHHHTYGYGPGFGFGKEIGSHIPGPYIPPIRHFPGH